MFNIKRLCVVSEVDPNQDLNMLGGFGNEAIGEVSTIAAEIAKYHNGERLLDKAGLADIEDKIVRLRHVQWLMQRVEEFWQDKGNMVGSHFSSKFGNPLHQKVTDAELMYTALLAALQR